MNVKDIFNNSTFFLTWRLKQNKGQVALEEQVLENVTGKPKFDHQGQKLHILHSAHFLTKAV